jgi:phosphoribosylformylglycinamidine synthase
MGDACKVLETPVTGGNVSFYNESPKSAVFPTPTIGMLGVLDDVSKTVTSAFKNSGDEIFLLTAYRSSDPTDGLGGSEYLSIVQNGQAVGDAPYLDLDGEKRLIATLLDLANSNTIASAHDVSEGGLLVSLAESCFGKKYGINVSLDVTGRRDAAFFGEQQGRVVVSVKPGNVPMFLETASKYKVSALKLGNVSEGTDFVVQDILNVSVEELLSVYRDAIPQAMAGVTD